MARPWLRVGKTSVAPHDISVRPGGTFMSGNSTGSTAKSGQPARSTHRRASTPTSTFDRVSTNASTRRAPVTLSRAWLAGAALLCALSTASVAGEEAFQSRTFAADPTWQATAGAFAVTGGEPGALRRIRLWRANSRVRRSHSATFSGRPDSPGSGPLSPHRSAPDSVSGPTSDSSAPTRWTGSMKRGIRPGPSHRPNGT